MNSVVLQMLVTQVQEEDEWDQWLLEVQGKINNCESKVTKRTPFELLHGYRPRFAKGNMRNLSETLNKWVCPEELWNEAREASERSKAKMKADYDRHRHDNTKFVIGEIVVMATVPTHTGESTKLQRKYKGPLTVTEVLPGDVYRVMQLKEDPKRQFTTAAHVSQLKSWKLEDRSQDSTSNEDREPINPGLTEPVDNARRSNRVRRRPTKGLCRNIKKKKLCNYQFLLLLCSIFVVKLLFLYFKF